MIAALLKQKKVKILSAVVVVVLFLGLFPGTAQADQGIEVNNGLIQGDVTPGEIFTHTLEITSEPTGSELDILVEACGYGQSPDGSTIPLLPAEDTKTHSAREFITGIQPAEFHLTPGESKEVEITITVPDNLNDGTYYAIVYIHSEMVESSANSGFVLAVNVPVVLTPDGTSSIKTGTITEVTVDETRSGQPLQIHTFVENTGNRHYRAYNEITITDTTGQEIAFNRSVTPASPILPTYIRRFDTRITPAGKLETGTYHVKSEIFHEDGTRLDSMESDFEVSIPWEVFPPQVVESSIETFTFDNEEPYEIDATDNSNVRIDFTDTGTVSGLVITGRYDEPPQVAIPFSAPEGEGGTGSEGLLYSAIHVDGFSQGTVRVSFLYDDSRIAGFDETSLLIAYWNGAKWHHFNNIQVFSGANYITGEAPVTALVGAPVALGGQSTSESIEGQLAEMEGETEDGKNTPFPGWWIALIAVGALVLITVVILFIVRRQHK